MARPTTHASTTHRATLLGSTACGMSSQYFDRSASMAAPPLAYSVEEAAARANCGRTTVFAAIKSGALKARKIGRRTIILDEDLRRWLVSLPMRGDA